MSKFRYLSIVNIVLIICALVVTSACKKDNVISPERRSFKPNSIKVTSGETSAKIEWKAPLFSQTATSYVVEISRDTTFAGGAEFTYNTDSTALTISSEDVLLRQKYFARIKANAVDNLTESKWMTSSSFRITGIQIFTGVSVNDTEILVSWREASGLTKIVLTPKDKPSIDIAITAADIQNKRKLISNLSSSNEYEIEIFAGTQSMGYTSTRTKAPISSGNIVDLRSFSNTNVFADTLLKIPSGSTVILKRGLTYTVASTINIDRSLTIQSGDDLLNPDKAVIFLSSNFNFAANSQVDSVVFKNVVLKSDGYASKYVFNINTATTVGKIIFESCHAEIFRGFLRMQSATNTINNLIVNDCVIDSISNFGVVTSHNTGKINNISFRNSTIYKAEKFIVGASTPNSILVENCTFNEVPLGGAGTGNAYLIDYNTVVVTKIEFLNNIIGTYKRGGAGTAVKGIRIGTNSVSTISNNHITADFTQAGNNIAGTLYNKNASDLFVDPGNGNFTIKDASFAGKSSAGDPRWRIQ